jgi:hypothetical protein
MGRLQRGVARFLGRHHVLSPTPTSATHSLFAGTIITGPATIPYQVGSLPPGTYFFRCDVHPMRGTFVAR